MIRYLSIKQLTTKENCIHERLARIAWCRRWWIQPSSLQLQLLARIFPEQRKIASSLGVLAHYNPSMPLYLQCDASYVDLGAVLSHKFPDGCDRTILFTSRSLRRELFPNPVTLRNLSHHVAIRVWRVFVYLQDSRLPKFTSWVNC